MKQKLTAAIAGSYLGCEVIHTNVSGYVKRLLPKGVYQDSFIEGCHLRVLNTAEHNVYFLHLGQCQLLLTPLSAISDEHAVEVADMQMFVPEARNKQKDLLSCTFEKGAFFICHLHFPTAKVNLYELGCETIDYLRSVGYDLGHGNIPSLIDAGIAIDKSKS